MSAVIQKLTTVLNFKADDKKAKKYNHVFRTLIASSTALVSEIALVSGGLARLTSNVAHTSERLRVMSRTTNLTTDQIQKWQRVLKESGISTRVTDRSLEALARRLDMAKNNMGPALQTIRMLHIRLRKSNGEFVNMNEFLMRLTKRLAQFKNGQHDANIGQGLMNENGRIVIQGLRQQASVIQNTAKAYEDMGAIISQKTIKSARAFNISMYRIGGAVDSVRYQIAAQLMPVMGDIAKEVITWFQNNQKLIKQGVHEFLVGLLTVLYYVLGAFIGVAEILKPLADLTGGWGKAIGILTGSLVTLLALKLFAFLFRTSIGFSLLLAPISLVTDAIWTMTAAVLANPLFWPAAIIAGIVALGYELYKFFNGQENIFSKLGKLWGGFKSIFSSAYSEVKKLTYEFGDWLAKNLPKIIGKAAMGLGEGLWHLAKGALHHAEASLVGGTSNINVDDLRQRVRDKYPDQYGSSRTNNVTVNITGTSNPEEISGHIVKTLDDYMDDQINNSFNVLRSNT